MIAKRDTKEGGFTHAFAFEFGITIKYKTCPLTYFLVRNKYGVLCWRLKVVNCFQIVFLSYR